MAEALGYGDIYLFSRHFKQTNGIAPRAYRKTL
jgi:AraC-like DNA-binding protein